MQVQGKGFFVEINSLEDSGLAKILQKYKGKNITIMVDENTHDNCLEYLITTFPELERAEIMLFPVGEENKVIEVCFQVWEAMLQYEIHRNDLVINLGGGVVTDMGGFIASVYKRGIHFINIPTSLLAMVDAAIGGKTGIDFGSQKNLLGTFQNPDAIFIDISFLETLPAEEIFNGYAEMLKHAIIKDNLYWDQIKKIHSEDQLVDHDIIYQSVKIKMDIIEADPKEEGIRKSLNFGHTIGHGIEGYFFTANPISHGHAVALGIIAESFISMKKKMLDPSVYKEIEETIISSFPMITIPEHGMEDIVSIISNDKKNSKGKISCVLLEKIGQVKIDCVIDKNDIGSALLHLSLLAQSNN